MKELLKHLLDYLPPIVLAASGGLVRTLRVVLRGEKYSFWKAVAETITAGFTGLLLHFLLQETEISINIQAFCIAMSGYISSELLPVLKAKFLKTINHNGEKNND